MKKRYNVWFRRDEIVYYSIVAENEEEAKEIAMNKHDASESFDGYGIPDDYELAEAEYTGEEVDDDE